MGSIPKHNIYVFQLLIKLSLKKDENKQKEADIGQLYNYSQQL